MRRPLPFIGPQASHRIAEVSDEQTINFIPTPQKPGSRSPMTLQSTPGLTKETSISAGPFRSNGVKWNGYLYFVSGNEFIQRDSSGVWTSIGTINTSAGWVVIDKGRDHIAFVDGTDGWAYNGSSLVRITDGDFPASPTYIAYLDARWIVNVGDSDRFYMSDVEDPYTWDPLDFATAEANPDDVLALAASEKDLCFIGQETAQFYYGSENPDFPFAPYINGTLEIGIDAPYSLVQSTQGLFWLASNNDGDLFVVRVQGQSPTMISDPDFNSELFGLSTTSDARGSLYRMEGRTYYVLSFPSADRTYRIEVDTGLWHRVKSFGIGRHRAEGYGYLGKKVICGDYTNSNVYELDFDAYTDNGGVIERYRRTRVQSKDQRHILFHEIRFDMKTGVGNGDEANPTLQLRYSDDNGNTWSSWLTANIGASGEYQEDVVFYRLGRSKNRIFEFRCTDPVSTEIFNVLGDVETLEY